METGIIVALIGVFASFMGLLISKEQKTSEFRQAWINTLRNDISNFIGQIDSVSKLVLINKTSNEEEKKKTSNDVILGSVKMRELQSKISLLINPKEEDHQELVGLLKKTIENIMCQSDNRENIANLTKLTQKILKEEWKRVKDGETFFKFFKWFFGIAIFVIVICLAVAFFIL